MRGDREAGVTIGEVERVSCTDRDDADDRGDGDDLGDGADAREEVMTDGEVIVNPIAG